MATIATRSGSPADPRRPAGVMVCAARERESENWGPAARRRLPPARTASPLPPGWSDPNRLEPSASCPPVDALGTGRSRSPWKNYQSTRFDSFRARRGRPGVFRIIYRPPCRPVARPSHGVIVPPGAPDQDALCLRPPLPKESFWRFTGAALSGMGKCSGPRRSRCRWDPQPICQEGKSNG